MADMAMQLTITQPDDLHLHIRDHAMMALALSHTARVFARAIIMPNLAAPITTTEAALAYRDNILVALPKDRNFNPLMTLYLTDNTPASEIEKIKSSAHVHAIKYYPAGATTNSDSGVSDLSKTYNVLEQMEKQDIPLLVHGEVTDPQVDIFDREKIFIDRHLTTLVNNFPSLRIVFEHITTKDAVDFVSESSENIGATITAHHLLLNRSDMLVGGIKPHLYCLPVLKRETHRASLLQAATSANPKFFLGTDSAPHPIKKKESACGCAGIYTAHAALELYAEVFEQEKALDKLEGFSSQFGADFYKLPRNTGKITLKKSPYTIPDSYPVEDDAICPLRAGESVGWTVL